MQRNLVGDPEPVERTDGEAHNDDVEDEEWEERLENLFGFDPTEACIVTEMVQVVRSLLTREDVTPEQIYHLAKVLFALERLPLPTPGVDVGFTLGYKHGGESFGQSLTVSESAFVLGTGAYILGEAGGDTCSEITFEVHLGSCSYFENWFALSGWAESIKEMAADGGADLDVWSLGDDEKIDWDDEPDEEAWDLLH